MPGMKTDLEIRESRPADRIALAELYPAAFPDEDLVPLVRELLAGRNDVLSLVADGHEGMAGHIAFTACSVAGHDQPLSMLAPLAVHPAHQRQGIGTGLIREGVRRLEGDGVSLVLVLGDPAYYGRAGFKPEHAVAPPYPLPEEWRDAWQSLSLIEDASGLSGVLCVPEPWRKKALWLP